MRATDRLIYLWRSDDIISRKIGKVQHLETSTDAMLNHTLLHEKYDILIIQHLESLTFLLFPSDNYWEIKLSNM